MPKRHLMDSEPGTHNIFSRLCITPINKDNESLVPRLSALNAVNDKGITVVTKRRTLVHQQQALSKHFRVLSSWHYDWDRNKRPDELHASQPLPSAHEDHYRLPVVAPLPPTAWGLEAICWCWNSAAPGPPAPMPWWGQPVCGTAEGGGRGLVVLWHAGHQCAGSASYLPVDEIKSSIISQEGKRSG